VVKEGVVVRGLQAPTMGVIVSIRLAAVHHW